MTITTTNTPSRVLQGNPPSASHQPDPTELVTFLQEVLAAAAADADLTAVTARVTTLEAADGVYVPQGVWDASSGSFPSGASVGDLWEVSTGGTVDSVSFVTGDQIVALVDSASTSTYAANWFKRPTSGVTSVAGRTGAVTLTSADVGLGDVDNTADADKPVSTAQQTALDLKAPLASPALTGVPTAPTAASDTDTTQIATTAFVQTVAAEVAAQIVDPAIEDMASEQLLEWAVVVEDPDGLGARVAIGQDENGQPLGYDDGGASEVFSASYAIRTKLDGRRRDVQVLSVLRHNQANALGLTASGGSWQSLHATVDARDIALTPDDRAVWRDAATGYRWWAPASGIPAVQTDATRYWTGPKRADPGARVLAAGDSLTVRLGPDLEDFAGVDTIHDGISGSATDGISARLGVEPVQIRVTGGSIPGDGSYVTITRITPNPDGLTDQVTGPLAPGTGTLSGTVLGVPCYLRRVGGVSTGAYEIARQVAGSAVTVADDSHFLRDLTDRDDRILILWAGRNDVTNAEGSLTALTTTPQEEADIVTAQILNIKSKVNTLTKQMLVLAPPYGPEDTTEQRAMIDAITTDLKAALGDWSTEGGDFVDLNAIALDTGEDGLAALAGVTLSADDLTDIGNGIWPRSLRESPHETNLHQNTTADAGLVVLLYEVILPAKGWI